MKDITGLILLFVLFFSCQEKKQESVSTENVSSFREIDLGSNLKDSGEKMLLSDLVEDVEYIKLETTDASLLASIVDMKMHNDHLFIHTLGVDNNSALIKVFERNGKFVRSVGKIGNGPGEFRLARDYDIHDSLLFVNTNWTHKIMIYNWQTNRFVKDFPLAREVERISCLEGDKIALYPGAFFIPKSEKEKNFFSTVIVSSDGKEDFVYPKQISDQDTSCVNEYKINTIYHWPYLFENNPNYYDEINDTIYRVKSDGIEPCYFINKGKYKMPICDYFIDEKLFQEGESYIQGVSFIETRSFLYMDFSCQRKKWIVRYDKSDGTVKCWAQKGRIPERVRTAYVVDGGGFYNDVDGGSAPIWNTKNGGEYIYSIIYQDNTDWSISKLKEKDVKFPEKREEIIKLLNEFGEDDNPILVLYKLKQ